MITSDLLQLTVTELSVHIRRRTISIEELVRVYLNRIESLNSRINAFVAFRAEKTLKEAKGHDELISRGQWIGPLHGIPIAIKDNCWTTDFPTTACSAIMKNYQPPIDASVVASLRAAGAIIMGKTNMHEWAYGATNELSLFGPVRNPWNNKHISGGSSGGSSAAVATGMVPAAIGSDTAGSVRIPSAACGISGIKPSYGTVSRYGIFPLSWSFDAVGPMARSVEDLSLILNNISGKDVKDKTSHSAYSATTVSGRQNLKGLLFAIPAGDFFKQADAVKGVFNVAVKQLVDDGALVEEVEIPGLDQAYVAWDIIESLEASAYHAAFMEKSIDEYSSNIRLKLEAGRCISAMEYVQAQQYQVLFNREIDGLFSSFDALLSPTLPVPPPLIGAEKVLLRTKEFSSQEAMIRFTWIANFCNLPAVTVPCGFEDGGLPIGLMFMGKKFADLKILSLACRYQNLTQWHKIFPKMFG